VRQCATECGSAAVLAVQAVVCDIEHNGVRTVRAAVCRCAAVTQCTAVCGSARSRMCGSVWQ
jgi:hypothetical protein